MNITKEDTGKLTATIKVEIEENDYLDAVKKILKDYQKKANMPGFRPGKVPFGIIQKMYGKAVKADEVNKLLSETLNNYLIEEKINTLGHPIANTEKTSQIDFENENKFDFFFDIGLSPELDLEISDKTEVDFYKITVSEKELDKQIAEIQIRYGTETNPEESAEQDILKGKIEQIDKDNNPIEGGISKEATLEIDSVQTKTEKKKFVGLKKEDTIVFNPTKALKDEVKVSTLLGTTKEETEKIEDNFKFSIEDITRKIPAELNKELFDKLFPTDNIETLEDFRKKFAQEMEKSYEGESENYFLNSAMENFVAKTEMEFPEEFLKRWLLAHNEGKITQEQIDLEFDSYLKSLKFQLIQNKIVTDFEIKVGEEEIRDHIRSYFKMQMPGGASEDEETVKRIESIVDSLIGNKEETQKNH
jgi:trigger factor